MRTGVDFMPYHIFQNMYRKNKGKTTIILHRFYMSMIYFSRFSIARILTHDEHLRYAIFSYLFYMEWWEMTRFHHAHEWFQTSLFAGILRLILIHNGLFKQTVHDETGKFLNSANKLSSKTLLWADDFTPLNLNHIVL